MTGYPQSSTLDGMAVFHCYVDRMACHVTSDWPRFIDIVYKNENALKHHIFHILTIHIAYAAWVISMICLLCLKHCSITTWLVNFTFKFHIYIPRSIGSHLHGISIPSANPQKIDDFGYLHDYGWLWKASYGIMGLCHTPGIIWDTYDIRNISMFPWFPWFPSRWGAHTRSWSLRFPWPAGTWPLLPRNRGTLWRCPLWRRFSNGINDAWFVENYALGCTMILNDWWYIYIYNDTYIYIYIMIYHDRYVYIYVCIYIYI